MNTFLETGNLGPAADKAFDADWLVKDLTERGSKVIIPPHSNRKAPREYDKEMHSKNT